MNSPPTTPKTNDHPNPPNHLTTKKKRSDQLEPKIELTNFNLSQDDKENIENNATTKVNKKITQFDKINFLDE